MASGGGRYRRRRSGGTALYFTMAAGFVILAAITAMSLFFKISEINVSGIKMYSADQVIEISGLETGNSIFFIRENAVAVRIKNELPYVDDVRVIRSFPGTVTIEIVESIRAASIAFDGGWLILDQNCKILEKTNTAGTKGTIEIRGATAVSPTVGGSLNLGSSESVRSQYLHDTLAAIYKANLQNEVTWLDVTNISAIRFDYRGYDINVCQGENLDSKLKVLLEYFEEEGYDHPGEITLPTDQELRWTQFH